MPFFDEIFREISSDYPEVEASLMHADALAARLVLAPHSFDVVVGSNLFGDLLSEVTAAIAGPSGSHPLPTSIRKERILPCSNQSTARPPISRAMA